MPQNPLDRLYSRMARFGMSPIRPQSRPERATPEEMAEAQRTLGQKAYGAATGAFNLLDLPASMIRDVVTLQNPFDQLLSPTSGKNRQSFIPEDAGLKDPRFWAGLAGEVILDPLTYLTLGGSALTKVGRAASKVGALDDLAKGAGKAMGKREALVRTTVGDLPKRYQQQIATRVGSTVEDIAGQRLGSAARWKLPFTDLGVDLGGGNRAAAFNRGLDVTGRTLRESAVGRKAHQLFNPFVRGAYNLTEQLFNTATTTAQRSGELTARSVNARLYSARAAEGLDSSTTRKILEGVGELPANASKELRQAFKAAKDYDAAMLQRGQALGNTIKGLQDETGLLYNPRRATWGKGRGGAGSVVEEHSEFEKMARRSGWGKAKEFNPAEVARVAPLRNIQGGTEQIRQIISDDGVSELILGGGKKEDVAGYLTAKYGDVIPESFETSAGKTIDQREALADLITKLTPEERAVGLFGNEAEFDRLLYGEHLESLFATQEQSLKWMAEHAGEPGVHTIGDTLKAIGLKRKEAVRHLQQMMPGVNPKEIAKQTVSDDLYRAITKANAAHRDPKVAKDLSNWMDSITNWFKANVTVPWAAFHTRNLYGGQFVNAVSGFYTPQVLRTWRELDAFAQGRTSVVPSAKSLPSVKEELTRRGLDVNDENATRILMEFEFTQDMVQREPMTVAKQLELQQGGVGAPSGVGGADVADLTVNPVRTRGVRMVGESPYATMLGPGLNPLTGDVGRMFTGRAEGTTLSPRAMIRGVRGVGDNQVSTFGPVAAGEATAQRVEFFNRMVPFVELQKQGYSPAKAAEMVKAAQVDYSSRNFTQFERTVMKRAFPFYSWQSRMIPFTVKSMIEKPQLRSTMRLQERATESQGEFIPDRYRRQPAMLLGGRNPLGYQNVLSQIDLAHNAALEPFQFGPTLGGSLKRTGRSLIGNTHPIFKLAAEQGMGVSTFTGRNTGELEGGISTLLKNVGEQLGYDNTPKIPQPVDNALLSLGLSRVVAPLRSLSDPRTPNMLPQSLRPSDLVESRAVKTAVNFLTGARIATYDPQQELASGITEDLEERGLAGRNLRTFDRLYIPRDREPYVTQQERRELLQANTAKEDARNVREWRDRVLEIQRRATGP